MTNGAGTVDRHAAERMSERNEGTVEREWVVVGVKEQDGMERNRERLGRITRRDFLLAGDLRPLN